MLNQRNANLLHQIANCNLGSLHLAHETLLALRCGVEIAFEALVLLGELIDLSFSLLE